MSSHTIGGNGAGNSGNIIIASGAGGGGGGGGGSLHVNSNGAIVINGTLNVSGGIPRVDALMVLMGSMLKDVMFEIMYQDDTKDIVNFDKAYNILMDVPVKDVKPVKSAVAKVLFNK